MPDVSLRVDVSHQGVGRVLVRMGRGEDHAGFDLLKAALPAIVRLDQAVRDANGRDANGAQVSNSHLSP
jgi:hypothetical protein